MAHQSGIRANDTVVASLSNPGSSVRAIKLIIDGEAIILSDIVPVTSDWESDYDKSILPLVDESTPCYLFYRLDSDSGIPFRWIFISWIPEICGSRAKTLYASTRASMRNQFGDSRIKEEIHGTRIDDVTLQGFKEHLLSKSAPAPLTAAEREKVSLLNNKTCSGFHNPHQTVKSVSFGLTKEASANVKKFEGGFLNYLQLSIDVEKEVIAFSFGADGLPPESMASYTPQNEGRYHLYRFNHQHNGTMCSALFFIHSICGYHSIVKSRMLYSSCKASLVSHLEEEYGLQITRRLEVEDMKEVTAAYLLDVLYPKPATQKLRFEKPPGPAGRRPRTQL